MAPMVTEIATPVPWTEFGRLRDHLPHSLPLLRRLQFTHYPDGTTEHARYLIATDSDGAIGSGHVQVQQPPPSPTPPSKQHFAAAYLDLSKGPETEMYLYTTLEDAPDPSALPSDEVERVLDLAVSLLQRGKLAAQEALRTGAFRLARGPGGFLVGGLHQPTYELLRATRGLTSSYWNPHDAWLFRLERLPPTQSSAGAGPLGAGEEEGLRWDVVRRDDVPLIASRTYIPKIEATLMSEPSVAVRDAEGTLVAWGFMGVAGTLSTLHVEEPFRGKGLAKAVATKVLREHSFGNDGWGSADVHVDNAQSQGVCKALGGEKGWKNCW
ncbi:hypothetical protein DHEL01_v205454 [Diaporthe helianthi]|uniref:GCN5-related N-acetyltransferase Rv2170-like domain-containing protein n=1 Tax=Diaporthe helianthi TaxID=158607 RepID=A0A2P5I0W5_DIAHE|nr:hypothetical protein DHEL01_v205454 [Diaporthe helianthi]